MEEKPPSTTHHILTRLSTSTRSPTALPERSTSPEGYYPNRGFYDKAFSGYLAKISEAAGLKNCYDMTLIHEQGLLPTTMDASILVLGAGYGREVADLLRRGYTNITAIEIHSAGVAAMQEEFADDITAGHLSILQQNFYDFQPEHPFDCVLWLWCGLNGQSKEQQTVMIQQKLPQLVTEQGHIVIDIADPNSKSNVAPMGTRRIDGHTYTHITQTPDGSPFHAYMGSPESTVEQAAQYFAKQSVIPYSAIADRNRFFIVLSDRMPLAMSATQQTSPRPGAALCS